MKLFIIFIIILIILFLPIPIKIKIEYLNNNLIIKLYKYTLFSTKNGIENKLLKKIIKKEPKVKETVAKSNAKMKHPKKISIKKLYKNISTNRFKPKLKINAFLIYGFDDAAFTALLYGLLCNLPNLLYFFLSIIFNIKKLSFDIDPKFNTTLLSFGITSIFYFNIANIIYMLFLLLKSIENKEVAPKSGRNI